MTQFCVRLNSEEHPRFVRSLSAVCRIIDRFVGKRAVLHSVTNDLWWIFDDERFANRTGEGRFGQVTRS